MVDVRFVRSSASKMRPWAR